MAKKPSVRSLGKALENMRVNYTAACDSLHAARKESRELALKLVSAETEINALRAELEQIASGQRVPCASQLRASAMGYRTSAMDCLREQPRSHLHATIAQHRCNAADLLDKAAMELVGAGLHAARNQ